MTGLYLKHPHSRLIYDGRKSCIAQSTPVPITGTHTLISKESGIGLAYGLVTIASPVTIDCAQFDAQFNLHRVTTKEREKWWGDSESLLLYPITSFVPYAIPLTVDVPAGVQMIMPEIKFIDINPDQSSQDVEEVENKEVEKPEDNMPWKASDAQSHTKLADTPAKQKRWAAIANSALAACKGDVKKCEASAIRQANSVIKKTAKKEIEDQELIDSIYSMVKQQVLEELEQLKSEEVTHPEVESESKEQEEESAEISQAAIPQPQDAPLAGVTEGDNKESEPEVTATVDTDVSAVMVDEVKPDRKSALAKFFQDSLSSLKNIIGLSDSTDDELTLNRVKSFSSKDGSKSYFVIWPTNSYFDRDMPPEAFRATALHSFVDRMDSSSIKSRAQFWHLSQTSFGNIIWQDVIEERFLVQVGEYDNTPVGNAFKSFFTKYPDGHPVIAPEGWGASHGYHYNADDRNDGVYDWLHTDESTVLPLRYAANLLNPSPVLGGKEMDDKRRDALRAISDEIPGLDLVAYVEATAKAARELADGKVEHKEMTEKAKTPKPKEDEMEDEEKKDPKKVPDKKDPDKKEIEVAESATTEVQDKVTPAAADINTIVDEMVKQAGLKELSETIASVLSRLEKLEIANETKAIEETREEPRYAQHWAWLENSKSKDTILTDAEKAEFKSKLPNTKNSAVAQLVENFNL